jgi:hypothetical protein
VVVVVAMLVVVVGRRVVDVGSDSVVDVTVDEAGSTTVT